MSLLIFFVKQPSFEDVKCPGNSLLLYNIALIHGGGGGRVSMSTSAKYCKQLRQNFSLFDLVTRDIYNYYLCGIIKFSKNKTSFLFSFFTFNGNQFLVVYDSTVLY